MHRQNLIAAFFVLFAGTANSAPLVVPAERFPDNAGRHLYAELGCGNCHENASKHGPSLLDLPKRVNHEWILTFLKDPEHKRMPALFDNIAGAERDQAVRDVAAYLSTLTGGLKDFKAQRHANAERGSALYHEIGCVACHAPTPDFKPKRPVSPLAVPLPDLKKKTSLMALTDFLLNTGKYRPNPRMPQFPLEPQEALDIAAHLLDFQSSDPREAEPVKPWPKASDEMIERGKARVTELNCAACHTIPGIEAAPPAGMPNKNSTCKAARFDLSEGQKKSITGFLQTKRESPEKHAALARFNCYACHSHNSKGGPLTEPALFFTGDESLGDSGRFPPPLSGAGKKLQPATIRDVLLGKPGTRVRPYLKTRMPVYSEAHSTFFATDVFDTETFTLPKFAQVDDLEAGRKLLGTNGGVNCITCHRWGDQPSLGIQGPDISDLDKRMNADWFRDYLLNPAKYRPGTLMPALWPDGKSSVKDILGGDTEKQIGAIWAFIRNGAGLPDGYPDKSTGQFELVPKDRPVIQRTFLEGVGTHAILVGFPGGINLAYDGKSAQPALLWHGRFFDAYATWFSRFAPFEKPLEKAIMTFPDKPAPGRYLGYEIDKDGNPVFLSQRSGSPSREEFKVVKGRLVYTIDGQSKTISLATK